jgi:hypothetical protein
MNRRQFLQRTFGTVAAAAAAPLVAQAAVDWGAGASSSVLTFAGIPVVANRDLPAGVIYLQSTRNRLESQMLMNVMYQLGFDD